MKNQWPDIVVQAEAIRVGYEPLRITLRQVFYRLVAAQIITNTESNYKQLSDRIARAREAGLFGDLVDNTRHMQNNRPPTVEPADTVNLLLERLAGSYQRHRQDGQHYQVFVGVEKDTLAGAITAALTGYDIPVVPMRGFASVSFKQEILETVADDPRPAVLLYIGDYDPSGLFIPVDFRRATDCWDEYRRVALNGQQVEDEGLPFTPAKPTDPNFRRMLDREGRAIQCEAEALDPQRLVDLLNTALAEFFDFDVHRALRDQEQADRQRLTEWLAGIERP